MLTDHNTDTLKQGVQPFYGKGPHTLLYIGSRAARGKVTVMVYLTAQIIV